MKKSSMKIVFFIGILFALSLIAAPVSAGDYGNGLDASVAAYDGILTYYSAMTKVENTGRKSGMDYKDRETFLKEHREMVVNEIKEKRAFGHIADAHQVFENLYDSRLAYHPYTREQSKCVADAYVDTLTGHKYVRQGPNSYAEYTKRGEYLKSVPADLPLLTKSQAVMPIDHQPCYILYEKYQDGRQVYLSLPADEGHPKNGWKTEEVLTSLSYTRR